MASNPTQLSAATALVQLLTEQPDLHKAAWRIPSDGPFAGTLRGSLTSDVDVRPAVAAWAYVLGATPREVPFAFEDVEQVEYSLETVWRDVPVTLYLSCPLSALVERVAA